MINYLYLGKFLAVSALSGFLMGCSVVGTAPARSKVINTSPAYVERLALRSELLRKAESLYQERQFESAWSEIGKIEKGADTQRTRLIRIKIALQIKDVASASKFAEEYFDAMVSHYHGGTELAYDFTNLATAFHDQGQWKLAEKCIDRALVCISSDYPGVEVSEQSASYADKVIRARLLARIPVFESDRARASVTFAKERVEWRTLGVDMRSLKDSSTLYAAIRNPEIVREPATRLMLAERLLAMPNLPRDVRKGTFQVLRAVTFELNPYEEEPLLVIRRRAEAEGFDKIMSKPKVQLSAEGQAQRDAILSKAREDYRKKR